MAIIDTSKLKFKDDYTGITAVKSLSDYDNAISAATRKDYQRRIDLLKYYDTALLFDSHLKNLYNLRKGRIFAMDMSLTLNETDITDITKSNWFKEILGYALDAIFYGYSIFQIKEIFPNGEIILEEIPREYYSPLKNGILSDIYSDSVSTILDKKYDTHILKVFNNNDIYNIGEFAAPVRNSIIKTNALLHQSVFVEKNGSPLMIAKIEQSPDSPQYKETKRLINAYNKTGGKAPVITVTKDVDITFANNVSSANSELYIQHLNNLNDEISFGLIGSTMVTQDGSSYAQAKEHMNVSYSITKADVDFVKAFINTKLLPLLTNLNYFTSLPVFDIKFDNVLSSQDRQTEQTMRIEFAKYLKEVFADKIDEQKFAEKYGDLEIFKK